MNRWPRLASWCLGRLKAIVPDRHAATAVEYGLILAIIVLTAFGGIAALGNQTAKTWGNINAAVANAR